MASEELAKKLQSRLAAAEEVEQRPESEQSPVPAQSLEPDHACGDTPSELATKLNRRLDINDGNAPSRATLVFNPYTEFKEFSRKQIKDMEAMFKRYDTGKDGFIDLMELKLMMEKLGAPQTHLGLKNMIKEVDEDFDGKLSFREEESGLMALARLSEINVSTEGVMGAKDFFEAKVCGQLALYHGFSQIIVP
ncbi:EF-hand domain-containing protein D1 [Xenoophorus captivus]|uniref:EF-hand domain-containing protein D1 n=1 Tax=Xenoophorus captivus TaxID=1517983 RepID=A0ABV0RQJ0_9TELE